MTASRTMLFLPASRPALVAMAARRRPDLAVLDLEDAVLDEEKDVARELLDVSTAALAAAGTRGLVRVNCADSRHFAADVEAVLRSARGEQRRRPDDR